MENPLSSESTIISSALFVNREVKWNTCVWMEIITMIMFNI